MWLETLANNGSSLCDDFDESKDFNMGLMVSLPSLSLLTEDNSPKNSDIVRSIVGLLGQRQYSSSGAVISPSHDIEPSLSIATTPLAPEPYNGNTPKFEQYPDPFCCSSPIGGPSLAKLSACNPHVHTLEPVNTTSETVSSSK